MGLAFSSSGFAAPAILPALAKTRVWGFGFENPLFPWGWSAVSSTSRWGYWPAYDRIVSDRLDQRYFAGLSGRFLSSDPYEASGGASDPGSWNRYPYVGGDPVNGTDPTGLFVVPAEMAVLLAESLLQKQYTSITVHDSYPDLAEAMLAFKRAPDQHQKDAAFEHLRRLAADSIVDYASSLVNSLRSTLVHKDFSSHCDDWLQKTLGVSVDDVKAGLRNADIQVGNGSLVQMIDMVKNRTDVLDAQKRVLGSLTIAQNFENNPSVSAVGELGGNRIFVNAMSVAQLGEGFFAGTLIHEVIHNITSKFDHEIQDKMGVGYVGGSRNITVGIVNNCMYK